MDVLLFLRPFPGKGEAKKVRSVLDGILAWEPSSPEVVTILGAGTSSSRLARKVNIPALSERQVLSGSQANRSPSPARAKHASPLRQRAGSPSSRDHSRRAYVRFGCRGARLVTRRRASGICRSASLGIGRPSRAGSGPGNAAPAVVGRAAWGCVSDSWGAPPP